mmetsp:Transcript_14766/g.42302  ORF Transcript_14766/g.42302 Transcript_14766/m.42302 type:complete len:322 (-) Transcript_14766:446-1411(-)
MLRVRLNPALLYISIGIVTCRSMSRAGVGARGEHGAKGLACGARSGHASMGRHLERPVEGLVEADRAAPVRVGPPAGRQPRPRGHAEQVAARVGDQLRKLAKLGRADGHLVVLKVVQGEHVLWRAELDARHPRARGEPRGVLVRVGKVERVRVPRRVLRHLEVPPHDRQLGPKRDAHVELLVARPLLRRIQPPNRLCVLPGHAAHRELLAPTGGVARAPRLADDRNAHLVRFERVEVEHLCRREGRDRVETGQHDEPLDGVPDKDGVVHGVRDVHRQGERLGGVGVEPRGARVVRVRARLAVLVSGHAGAHLAQHKVQLRR